MGLACTELARLIAFCEAPSQTERHRVGSSAASHRQLSQDDRRSARALRQDASEPLGIWAPAKQFSSLPILSSPCLRKSISKHVAEAARWVWAPYPASRARCASLSRLVQNATVLALQLRPPKKRSEKRALSAPVPRLNLCK